MLWDSFRVAYLTSKFFRYLILNKINFYIVSFLLFALPLCSQDDVDEKQKNFDKRILFVLDGSGSMKESWQGETKWEMAVSTLSNLIDSFQKVNNDFEIGIRVLGHQYPRAMTRCDDSKLEIPFSKDLTYQKVHETLSSFRPQGHTPLAYSIAQSEIDFPRDITALHSIVLITDGLENCGGNPCEVAQKLREKNIFITPYIIGLGIDSLQSHQLECIGKFVDAKNKEVFRKVIQNVLQEVSVKTTLNVFYVGSDGKPVEHYVPYSLVDKRTRRDISNFIYTANSKRHLDTIRINPQYTYALLSHTQPPIYTDTFRMTMGTHNVWTVVYDYGTIDHEPKGQKLRMNYMLRDHHKENRKIYNQSSYYHQPLLESTIDILEYPNHSKTMAIHKTLSTPIHIAPKGILKIRMNEPLHASIYDMKWNLVMHLSPSLLQSYELIHGDYYLVYKLDKYPVDMTKYQSFRIVENQTIPIAIP